MEVFGSQAVVNRYQRIDDTSVLGENIVCFVKGQLGLSLTVYPWYLLCSLGILGDYNL